MIDFETLDPEVRCVALVGSFLRHWSVMEIRLHEAIGVALQLNETSRAILCANMQLRDKISLVRTMVHISNIPNDIKIQFDKKLESLKAASGNRNMMAHDSFSVDNTSDTSDGVAFARVKAKGTFSEPKIVWSIKKFKDEFSVVDDLGQTLLSIKNSLSTALFTLPDLGWFRYDIYTPTHRIMSSALIDHVSRQGPVPPDTPLPNPEQVAQIPHEPEG